MLARRIGRQGWIGRSENRNRPRDEGGKVGVASANRVSWEKSKTGSEKMWKDVAYSTSSYRTKADYLRRRDSDQFYEEDPESDS